MQEVKIIWVINVQLFIDSTLMASQFGGIHEAKNDRMFAYLDVL